tara:strand:- start:8285 stop:8962 length:678 start_codon:yes stop_codon:yes gene_type:complete
MKTLTVFLNVRKNSSRLRNKLLRPFAGSNLFKIALDKLEVLSGAERYVCAYDRDFLDLCSGRDVDTLKRSKESASVDLPLNKVFECLYSFNTDYAMFLNPCHAHLKVNTIQGVIDSFMYGDFESGTSAVKVRDWIFNEDFQMIAPRSLGEGDTKKTGISYVVAHAFHIYNIQKFLESNIVEGWKSTENKNRNDPHLFEISKIESLDVDDYEDFLISESVYRNSSY